jgi:hypothetical protein
MMMWELLAGQQPWQGMSEVALIAAVRVGAAIVVLHATVAIASE